MTLVNREFGIFVPEERRDGVADRLQPVARRIPFERGLMDRWRS